MKKDKFIYEAPSAEITALLVRAGILLDDSPNGYYEGGAGDYEEAVNENGDY